MLGGIGNSCIGILEVLRALSANRQLEFVVLKHVDEHELALQASIKATRARKASMSKHQTVLPRRSELASLGGCGLGLFSAFLPHAMVPESVKLLGVRKLALCQHQWSRRHGDPA